MLNTKTLLELLRNQASEAELVSALEAFVLESVPAAAVEPRFSALLADLMMCLSPEFCDLKTLASNAIDCCGTGGSGIATFNTSTAVAFVLAGAGLRVAKFGNRSASGNSGSFDVLEQLGIPLVTKANQCKTVLERTGLLFLSATSCYPILASLGCARKRLGKRTLLNYAGPLLNPMAPSLRVLGVSDATMQEVTAKVLVSSNFLERAFVVRSACGLDELCPDCGATIYEVEPGVMREFAVRGTSRTCETRSSHERFATAKGNADTMVRLFTQPKESSAEFRLVASNAALGLLVAGRAGSYDHALQAAKDQMLKGRTLEKFVETRSAYAAHA